MDKFYLGTNWKMHKTVAQAREYIRELDGYARQFPQFNFFIIPPYTALWQMREYIQMYKAPFLLGAQNVHFEKEGAYTGEISIPMLQEIGTQIIEIGHSERRQYYNETDYTVNQKAIQILLEGMTALICIGENKKEKEYGVSKEKLRLQLGICLQNIPVCYADKVWIAYEPVWAIGNQGEPADAAYVSEMHSCIRQVLCERWGTEGEQTRILYGGSVNEENCTSYLNDKNINGLFIGRSAWDAKRFKTIMEKICVAQKQKGGVL